MNELRILKAMAEAGEGEFSRAIHLYEILMHLDITKSQFYNAMRNLIDNDFVVRIKRGQYMRVYFYQWEFDDYVKAEHYNG